MLGFCAGKEADFLAIILFCWFVDQTGGFPQDEDDDDGRPLNFGIR
jgi:hypothetical protein